MKSICVYAGSASGRQTEYTEKAVELGHAIADKNFSMVYGGGSNGLMGVTADAALSKGAKVTGIITEQLDAIEGQKKMIKGQMKVLEQSQRESDATGQMGKDFKVMFEQALIGIEDKEKRTREKLKKYRTYYKF